MKTLFYVEMKNKSGEYEPLGIMTMTEAIIRSWNAGHATLQFTAVADRSPAEAR